MSKILVTGCCGFIGSNLVDCLLNLGFSVIGIDSLTDYYSPKIKLKNIKKALENNNFNFYNSDILNFDWKKIINDIEYVYHLAAEPGVRSIWKDAFKRYTGNNIIATQFLLESFLESKIKKFIFASSSSVYGNHSNIPLTEDLIPVPYSPYAVTKLAAEHLCKLYHLNYGFPSIIFRLFTVFGKRQRPDMAFHKIISSIKNESVFEVYGDGEQKRDYTYIDNINDALILAMDKGNIGSILNIGSGFSVSMNEVIRTFSEISGKEVNVKYIEKAKGDVINTLADISRAKIVLGYEPVTDLKNQMKLQFENHE